MYIHVNYWPSEYFADTSVRDTKLSGDVARSDALVSHFDNSLTDDVWQWSTVDEHSTELVHSAVTCTHFTQLASPSSASVSSSSSSFILIIVVKRTSERSQAWFGNTAETAAIQVFDIATRKVSESESECKCLTCNQKPTGSQFSLLHEPN